MGTIRNWYGHFLPDVRTDLPHIEVKWLTSLRSYLQEIDGSLELDNDGVLPIQRVNDFYLMTVILASGQFKPKEIRLLNYCRQYLQALTVSDITTAD
jgi:hypothetical protein